MNGQSMLRIRPPAARKAAAIRCRRGVGTIELALMAPVVALILIGALDFGRMAMERSAVGAAARAGALYAALNDGSTADAVTAAAIGGAGDAQRQRSVESRYFCICPSSGEWICGLVCQEAVMPRRFSEVTVSATIATLLPYPGIRSPLPISHTVRVQVI